MVSIFAADTATQFYEALSSVQVSDGTLNRFLVVEGSTCPGLGDGGDLDDIPEQIRESVAAISDRPGGINSCRFRLQDTGCDPMPERPFVVPWADVCAKQEFRDFERRMEPDDSGSAKSELGARCAENALRIATLCAISRECATPAVTLKDMQYGIAYALASHRLIVSGLEGFVPVVKENAIRAKILRFTEIRGGSVTAKDIMLNFGKAFKSTDELRKTALSFLIDDGRLIPKENKKKTGRPTTRYYTREALAAGATIRSFDRFR